MWRGRRGTERRRPPRGTPPPGARARRAPGPPAPPARASSRARRWRHGRRSRVRCVRHHVEDVTVLARVPPHDDVVEDGAVTVVEEVGVLRPPGGDLAEGRWTAPAGGRRGRPDRRPGPCRGARRRTPRRRHGRPCARRSCRWGTRAASPTHRRAPCGPRAGGGRRRAARARRPRQIARRGGPAGTAGSSSGISWASMSSFTPARGRTLRTP